MADIESIEEATEIRESAARSREAAHRAKTKAKSAKWDMNVVIFLFSILLIVIIMLFEGFDTWIVSVIAFLGLTICWLWGCRQEKQLYDRFFAEELERLIDKEKSVT